MNSSGLSLDLDPVWAFGIVRDYGFGYDLGHHSRLFEVDELGHTGEIKSIIDVVVDQMHQPWRTFATIINKSLSGKTTGLDKLRLSRAQILWGMYYKGMWIMLNYFGKISLTRLTTEVTKSKRRFIPPKKERKFKKLASPKLTTVPVSPEEPTKKSKRVKRPAKKSTNPPTAGVVIRDTHVMSLSKKKEKVIVEKRKGIELLSEVALIEEAQLEEVRKKSMKDFHKTHLSGSGKVIKIPPSAAKIKPSVTNEGTGAEPGVPNVTEEETTESSDQESDSGDDNTQSDNKKGSDSEHETDENETGSESDQEENEEEVEDNAEGDEDKGMDCTTNQFDDDVDVRLNEPVNADEGFIQKEGIDAEMINVQQGNENLEITLNQVIEDAHVTISTVVKKTEVPVTSSSHSSDLASKFLKFSDIPHTNVKIVSPMNVYVHHEVPSNQTPTLLTVPVMVITESSPIYTTAIPQSLPSFTPPPPLSTPTPPLTTEATNPLSALLNFISLFVF
ncbi:hypothetical protein Tco_0542889 [Tanacetum coccineum]